MASTMEVEDLHLQDELKRSVTLQIANTGDVLHISTGGGSGDLARYLPLSSMRNGLRECPGSHAGSEKQHGASKGGPAVPFARPSVSSSIRCSSNSRSGNLAKGCGRRVVYNCSSSSICLPVCLPALEKHLLLDKGEEEERESLALRQLKRRTKAVELRAQS